MRSITQGEGCDLGQGVEQVADGWGVGWDAKNRDGAGHNLKRCGKGMLGNGKH
jgi:hypothetical protein